MKSLVTLIKLYTRQLDEKRREMVVLEQKKLQLEAALERLREELKREQAIAASSQEARYSYSSYAKSNNERQQKFIQSISEVDIKIYTLTHTISLLYSEIKKFEIASNNKKRQVEQEETRKEDIRLADIALKAHMKREEEDTNS